MEVLFMDRFFNTTKIIDAFTSCIWNVEYIGCGDFELYFPMDYTSLTGIETGGYASIRESDRYMIVEGIDIKTSVEDGNFLIVTGRSLESILDRRIIREKTILTGKLQDCIMRLLNANAIRPKDPNRILDGLTFKESTDPRVTDLELDFELEPGDNLYDAIYTICEAYNLGFRILPLTEGKMQFELYMGKDHTYDQEKNPWIVFSPKFENLKESEMVVDTSTLKNNCYTKVTFKKQVAEGNETKEEEETITVEINGELTGLNRREIYLSKSNGVTLEKIDIADYGRAEDRVDTSKFMEYVPTGFDREGYEKAKAEYDKTYADRYAVVEKERTEWKLVEHVPEWQKEHPDENPYFWVSETIPGDSPETIRRKQAYNAAIAAREPKRLDYVIWGWEITDTAGYNQALRLAQSQINAEFNLAVANQILTMTNAVADECNAKVMENSGITKFTGEIDSNVNYKFGKDYDLGDVVQIVNEYDFQAQTRVVAMIYSQDTQSGFVMHPTFKSDNEAVFSV